MIYGTQWCDSNHPVSKLEKSGYLCCTYLCVPYTAKCSGDWQGLRPCRLISAQPLTESTIIEFSISSALWVLAILTATTLTQFLSNRSQHVMVDGCRSKLVEVVSGVLQGSVLGLVHTSELFTVLNNKLISHANENTLMTDLPSESLELQ